MHLKQTGKVDSNRIRFAANENVFARFKFPFEIELHEGRVYRQIYLFAYKMCVLLWLGAWHWDGQLRVNRTICLTSIDPIRLRFGKEETKEVSGQEGAPN